MNLFRVSFLSLGPMCALLAYLTVLHPLGLRRGVRFSLGVVLLLCSLKFTWFEFWGGDMFLPEMPAACLHFLSVAHDFVVVLALIGLAWSVALRVFAALRPKGRGPDMTRRRVAAGALAFAAGGISVKGVHDGIRLPDVVEVSLDFPDLPPEFDGYRIAQMSDLHVSAAARASRTAGVVRIVNGLRPDLIAITGDIVDGTTELRRSDVAPLAGLRAVDGVVGCTGNHEYYSGWGAWRGVVRSLGLGMLENEALVLRRREGALAVLGENDPVCGFSDIRYASARVPENAFRVLLAHRPTRLAEHASHGVSLQLSGHTHGGAALGIDRLVARANEGHVRGLYREHGLALYVNSGTGQWAGFPARLGVMPEITLITLRRGAGEERRV